MVTSDGPRTAARQIRLFVTRLSRHRLFLSPPPPIIDQQHRHRRQQRQAPVAHTPGELPRPFASLSLPKHQTGQDTAATSPTLTSACPLPAHRHVIDVDKRQRARQRAPSSQRPPTATSPAHRHVTGVDERQQARTTTTTAQFPTPAHCHRQRQQTPPTAHLFDDETPRKRRRRVRTPMTEGRGWSGTRTATRTDEGGPR